jgi:hypothetical protein
LPWNLICGSPAQEKSRNVIYALFLFTISNIMTDFLKSLIMSKYFLLFLLILIQPKFALAQTQIKKNEAQSFLDLNKSFLQDYNSAKQYNIQQIDNIIVTSGNTASWYQHGQLIYSASIVNDKYQLLKSLSHITLGISALFVQSDKIATTDYIRYHQTLEKLLSQLPKLSLTSGQLARQKQLILLDTDLIQKLEQQEANIDTIYEKYYHEVKPLIELNLADAAIEKLQIMKKVISPWLASMNKPEQQELYVVIAASVASRKHNLEGQFFAHYLGKFEDDEHLFVTENVFTPKDQLDVLSGYLLETKMGKWFGDEERFHRDLTADGAVRYLAQ